MVRQVGYYQEYVTRCTVNKILNIYIYAPVTLEPNMRHFMAIQAIRQRNLTKAWHIK